MTEEGLTLPPFTVRVSDRARRIRLTVTPRDGLVVVVPRRWRGDPAAIVASKAEWARAALDRIAEERALHAGGPSALLPGEVALPATGECYPVALVAADRAIAREVGGTLVVRGADDEARLGALRRWLDRRARDVLPARLADLARAHGITYARCRTAHTRSRWGSCSARGTISLSRNLLFLEPDLVDALILHELAHIRVMDHSKRFWSELERIDPDAHSHRVRLRDASCSVPPWADARTRPYPAARPGP